MAMAAMATLDRRSHRVASRLQAACCTRSRPLKPGSNLDRLVTPGAPQLAMLEMLATIYEDEMRYVIYIYIIYVYHIYIYIYIYMTSYYIYYNYLYINVCDMMGYLRTTIFGFSRTVVISKVNMFIGKMIN